MLPEAQSGRQFAHRRVPSASAAEDSSVYLEFAPFMHLALKLRDEFRLMDDIARQAREKCAIALTWCYLHQ
jgi:hypothetical protein